MSIKCLQIRVIGKVQGVWFRGSTQRKANELELKGFVKNEADGSVYIEVMGSEDAVKSFVEWCHEGSELAQVREVICHETERLDFLDFRVLR